MSVSVIGELPCNILLSNIIILLSNLRRDTTTGVVLSSVYYCF